MGTSIRINDDGVHILAVLLDHKEGHPAVLGILFPAFPVVFAHLCRVCLWQVDVGTGLGAVLLKGAALEELALHTGAAKQAATAPSLQGQRPSHPALAPWDAGDPRALPALIAHRSPVVAAGRGAARALLAEGGLVSSPALAAVAVAAPAEAAHVPAGVQAALRGLLALAGAALVARLALAGPAVALAPCCRGMPFRACGQPGRPPPAPAPARRAAPTLRSPRHPPWDAQGGSQAGAAASSPKPSQ